MSPGPSRESFRAAMSPAPFTWASTATQPGRQHAPDTLPTNRMATLHDGAVRTSPRLKGFTCTIPRIDWISNDEAVPQKDYCSLLRRTLAPSSFEHLRPVRPSGL